MSVRSALLALVAVLASVLAGCGSPAEQAPDAVAGGTFPLTIAHKFGTTTIPAEPKRIVTLSFEEDLLGRMGIATVGRMDNGAAPGRLYPWQEGVVDVTRSAVVGDDNGLDLERLAAQQPDLILATNYFGNDEYYERLSRIAPTVPWEVGVGVATWQQIAFTVGRAVGREADARRIVDDTERYLADVRRSLPGLEGRTYAGGYYYATGTFQVSASPQSQSARLRSALGLRVSPALAAAFPQGQGTLSIERIGLFDADLLLIGTATPELRDQLATTPLYRSLPVVREGRVVLLDRYAATAGNNPTPLNINWQTERLRPALATAAARG